MAPTPDWPGITRALLEALEPFAEAGAWYDRQYPGTPGHTSFTLFGVPVEESNFSLSDMRRARAAISAARQAGERGE